MDYSPDTPMTAEPDFPTSQGAFPVWKKVFTQPREQTFVEITEHREAKARSAYIWVFIAGTLSGLVNGLSQFIVTAVGLRQAAPDLGQVPGLPGAIGAAGLFGAICSAPLTGVLSVVGFAFGVAIVHATARFFGGQGRFDRLAYAFGAIAAPLGLVSALAAPLNIIPFAVFCTLPVLLVLSFYGLYLQVVAIKAVHRCGWGEAAAALFLPGILMAMLCGLLFLGLMRVVGPSLNEVLQQLQQVR